MVGVDYEEGIVRRWDVSGSGLVAFDHVDEFAAIGWSQVILAKGDSYVWLWIFCDVCAEQYILVDHIDNFNCPFALIITNRYKILIFLTPCKFMYLPFL